MRDNYLFERFRGLFNWKKIMRESVHLVGYFHVLVSYLELIGTTNWTATYPQVIYIIHLQSNLPRVSGWFTRSAKAAGIAMFAMTLFKVGIAIYSRKVSFR
jgi:hypothetical protein